MSWVCARAECLTCIEVSNPILRTHWKVFSDLARVGGTYLWSHHLGGRGWVQCRPVLYSTQNRGFWFVFFCCAETEHSVQHARQALCHWATFPISCKKNYKKYYCLVQFFQGRLDKNDIAGLPGICKVDEVGFHLYNTPAFVSQACITTQRLSSFKITFILCALLFCLYVRLCEGSEPGSSGRAGSKHNRWAFSPDL